MKTLRLLTTLLYSGFNPDYYINFNKKSVVNLQRIEKHLLRLPDLIFESVPHRNSNINKLLFTDAGPKFLGIVGHGSTSIPCSQGF